MKFDIEETGKNMLAAAAGALLPELEMDRAVGGPKD